MSRYTVEKQITTTYIDPASGDPVRGFEVSAVLYPWVEYVRIQVPDLKVTTIKPILDELIEQRDALDALSEAAPTDDK